ncbi:MAG: sigma-70 family RNA polymerase sigma factor [Phycisphaerae bacterium]|nr:sigma-70 family RNA polymerase sigma factor [Phycisphaerae bacterium]
MVRIMGGKAGPMSASEADLVARAVRGDTEALTELLEQEGPIVRQRLEAKIGTTWRSSFDADDVMQVSYMEAFMQVSRFSPAGPGAFRAWLTQIAENNMRDAIKSLERAKRPDPRKRVHGPPGEQSFVALVELLGVTNSTPSQHAARGEFRGAIDEALSKMPPDYSRVITLYDLEGRSAQEVAAIMGRSNGAVFMLRARAHDKLRELLGSSSRFFSTPS